MATQTLNVNDDKVKFTTDTELEGYSPLLEQEFVRKDKHPEGYIYKPTNLQPAFYGATAVETVMQFMVEKYKIVKGDKGQRSLEGVPAGADTLFLVPCAKFVEQFKRAA